MSLLTCQVLTLALRKRRDTELGGGIGYERDSFFRLIADYGALRHRIGDVVYGAPLVELVRLDAEPDGSAVAGERDRANFSFCNRDALRG